MHLLHDTGCFTLSIEVIVNSATVRSKVFIRLQQFLGKGVYAVAIECKKDALTVNSNPFNPFYVRIVLWDQPWSLFLRRYFDI